MFRQRVRAVTRGNQREMIRCGVATVRRARPTTEPRCNNVIPIFDDSRDSHPPLQDAMVKGLVRFGISCAR